MHSLVPGICFCHSWLQLAIAQQGCPHCLLQLKPLCKPFDSWNLVPCPSQDEAVSAWTTALFLPGASSTPSALAKRLRSGLHLLLQAGDWGAAGMHLEGLSLTYLLYSDGSKVPAGVPGTTNSLLFSVATWVRVGQGAAGVPAAIDQQWQSHCTVYCTALNRRVLGVFVDRTINGNVLADPKRHSQDHNSTWLTKARMKEFVAAVELAIGVPCTVRITTLDDLGETIATPAMPPSVIPHEQSTSIPPTRPHFRLHTARWDPTQ